MSTTTVSVNDKKHTAVKYAEDHKVVQDLNIPLKNKYLINVISLGTYRAIIEIMKSVFIIFTFLLAFKVAGLHDLWVQLVEKYFKL